MYACCACQPELSLLPESEHVCLLPAACLVAFFCLQGTVGIAFDLMSVNLADLPRLPVVVSPLKLLFSDQDDQQDDEEEEEQPQAMP